MLALRPGLLPVSRRRRTPGIHSLLAALLLLPRSSAAEGPAGEVRLDTVEVSAEAEDAPPPEPTAPEEPTGFGTVVETSQYAGRRMDVSELLLQAPGTRVHHAPGGETLMLRGGSADQSLVLLDGIPLNAVAGGGIDLRSVPAQLLERITVLRGNEGARYGAGALGGAALLQTRALRDEAGGAFSLSAGSFGTYQLGGAAWGGTGDATGLAAITLDRTAGDYPGPFDPTPEHDPSDARTQRFANNDALGAGALLKGRLALGDDARLHALVHGFLGDRGIPGTYFRLDTHRREERRLVAALRAEGEPNGDLRLFGGLELRHDELAVWSDEAARDVVSQPATDVVGKPWQIENALALRAGADYAPAPWTLVQTEATVGSDWLDSPYHGTSRRERLALQVADELYLGSAVTIVPAVRWDRVGEHEGWSPRIGAAYRPIAALEVRANWGRTFRAPSFGELYFEQALVKANPDLVPERGWSADGGVVVRFARATLQAAAFYARTEDLILYEQATAGTSKPFNFHDAAVRGGEIEARVQPLRWLDLQAGYDLTLTRNLRDDPRFRGKELPFRPPHRVYGRAGLLADGYEAFVAGEHQSSQFVNRANTKSLPGATTFGAGAGVRLAAAPWALWLSAQVDNVFDTHPLDLQAFPQPGRSFMLTLRALSPEADRRGLPEKP